MPALLKHIRWAIESSLSCCLSKIANEVFGTPLYIPLINENHVRGPDLSYHFYSSRYRTVRGWVEFRELEPHYWKLGTIPCSLPPKKLQSLVALTAWMVKKYEENLWFDHVGSYGDFWQVNKLGLNSKANKGELPSKRRKYGYKRTQEPRNAIGRSSRWRVQTCT